MEGRLETQKWVTDDGQNRSTIKMTVDKAHFCGPKQDGGDTCNTFQSAGAPVDVYFSEPLDGDDDGELPF